MALTGFVFFPETYGGSTSSCSLVPHSTLYRHTPYIPLQDFSPVATVFTSHVDAFWSFYLVDLREAIRVEDDVILKLQLFHTVNQYFSSQRECMCVCARPR